VKVENVDARGMRLVEEVAPGADRVVNDTGSIRGFEATEVHHFMAVTLLCRTEPAHV
jgi:hypothetical protein